MQGFVKTTDASLGQSLKVFLHSSTKWNQVIQLLIKNVLEIVKHIDPASSHPSGFSFALASIVSLSLL